MNLSCSADGFPVPDITLNFDGMMLTNETENSTNSTYTESTIMVNDLMLSDGGNYSCEIKNVANVMSSTSEAIVAVIGGKIKCKFAQNVADFIVIVSYLSGFVL